MSAKVVIDRERLAEVCRRHHIRKLALFGSVLREEFRPDSDVDVLVDFEPGRVIGFRIFDIEAELSRVFGGHRVDFVREKYLNRRLRDRVLATAETQYANGQARSPDCALLQLDAHSGKTMSPVSASSIDSRTDASSHTGMPASA